MILPATRDEAIMQRDATVREMLRPLLDYLQAPGATELCINRPGELFVEAGPHIHRHPTPELTGERLLQLARAIAKYTDQDISPRQPILSAMLPDGERIQIVVPPVVEPGLVSFTIRVPDADIRPLESYQASGAFARFLWAESPHLAEHLHHLSASDQRLIEALKSRDLARFLIDAVRSRKNIAMVGDTGSGKTTLMKSVCQMIPADERLITIEDVRELFLPGHANRVHLLYSKGGQGVAQVTPSELIGSTMRMKPSRVLMAELRGAEAFDFLKLLTSGHSGSVTSWHAESCALASERFVFMAKENAQAAIYDATELKRLVTLTIDVILHITAEVRHDDAGQPTRKERYVTEVSFDPAAKLRARFGEAILHQ